MDELRAGIGERENGEELLRILQAADTDGNGSINYTGEYQISVSLLNLTLIFRIHRCNHGRSHFP